ncbi:MAG TPA: mechanosensitive ion channel domain-containing protein [Bacteroidales bacterium]|nr:mechanosensitive ion channel domain-containing protein [Bacteroidales bacterium]
MNIIIVFFVAALIYFGFKTIRFLLNDLMKQHSLMDRLSDLMTGTEIILWLGFVFWAADHLFRDKFYYHYLIYALIIIVAGLTSWFFLRDVFAGLTFRIRHNLGNGSLIRVGDLSGQVKSQQLTCLILLTDDGKLLLRIPYSRIINEVVTELNYTGGHEEHTLHVRVELSVEKKNAESLIRSAVLNAPWSNLKEEPSIRFTEETEEGYFYEVTLLLINPKNMRYMVRALEGSPSLHVVS